MTIILLNLSQGAIFISDIQMHKLSLVYRIYTKPFSIIQCTVAIIFKYLNL